MKQTKPKANIRIRLIVSIDLSLQKSLKNLGKYLNPVNFFIAVYLYLIIIGFNTYLSFNI